MKYQIIEPYYPLYKIETGLYTKGGDFLLYTNLTDYIGLYHKLPSGECWSESEPTKKSIYLLKKNLDFSDDVKLYRDNNNIIKSSYEIPISYYPIPTADDYKNGFIYRCFVQKRNNPLNTIMEITSDQYNSLGFKHNGLNITIWNYIIIKWSISGSNSIELNKQQTQTAEIKFKGINQYIQSIGFDQFVK